MIHKDFGRRLPPRHRQSKLEPAEGLQRALQLRERLLDVMDLPTSIVFCDGSAFLPKHGYHLHGFDEHGEHVWVEIKQSDIPDLEDAGRFFFNRQRIELRSESETQILNLIEAATLSDELLPAKPGVTLYNPGSIFGKHALDALRRSILDYVRSDQYADIATNGVKDTRPVWERFRIRYI